MSQKLPLAGFRWVNHKSQFNKDFIWNYNEDSNVEYFIEVDIEYPEKLHALHNDLPFLHERMKIEKAEKLVAYLHDRRKCYSHKTIKTSSKSRISFEKSA